MGLIPQIILFIPGEWYIVHPTSRQKKKMIENFLIGLFCIFPNLVDEKIETIKKICIYILRINSDRSYSVCVNIS
jgi:hypothetical protein